MNLVRPILLILAISVIIAIYSSWNKNKVLLSSFKSGTEPVVIKASELPIIKASNNYAYSIWFYVKNWNYKLTEDKYLLSRTNGTDSNPQITFAPYENNINVSVATYPISSNAAANNNTSNIQTCSINNFPLQKWVNLIVSLNGRALDLYLDGKLVRTCILPGVAKINSDANVSVTPNGGFSGWTSNFQYFANPLNPQEAYNIYKEGYGGSGLGGLFEKYKIKISYLVDNAEKSSFEIF